MSGNIPPPQPRCLSGLGFNVTLNPGSIFPKYLGDRIRFQIELLSYKFRNFSITGIMLTRKAFVVHSVSVEGHLNGSVSGLVNTKSLTELAEENPELASGVLKGGRFRPWWVT